MPNASAARVMTQRETRPCRRCGSPDARISASGDLLCDRCADRRIAAFTGFGELPAPPPPFVLHDADGVERTLLVRLWRAPTGIVAEVEEPGEPGAGYERAVIGTHQADVEHLVARLRAIAELELTERYLEPNPRRPGFLLSGDEFEGRLEYSLDGTEVGTPYDVIVDGKRLSWEDLGRALEAFAGFRIRLEISDRIEDLRDET